MASENGIGEGYFKLNVLSGWGRSIRPDGKFHIGWWKNGIPHGYGIGNIYTD